MGTLLFKTIIIWLAIVFLAFINAAVREKVLEPIVGSAIALPVSGLVLSIVIFLVAYITIPFFDSEKRKSHSYVFIGVTWFTLTLSFEIIFGRFVAGKSWHEILQVFYPGKGDFFVVALLSALIAPWLSAKLRGVVWI